MATIVTSQDPHPARRDSSTLEAQAVALAADLLRASQSRETTRDRGRGEKMARMMDDPMGQSFTVALTDEVLRFHEPARAGRRFRHLLARFGAPAYLGTLDRWLLRLGAVGSAIFPFLVMPRIAARVRKESSDVIVPGERTPLHRYLAWRRSQGTGVNINQLGEAVLGEGEANRRTEEILERLADPAITYVSVKVSAIFSQIHLVGYETSLDQIKIRLRLLYRAAMAHGGAEPKFINLDMEEYRDLQLTVDAFCQVLEEDEFASLEAGIVLQAYLPDSFAVQSDLLTWAKARHRRTGAGIKIRLVKGANLAMEQVEASLHGWPQAPYSTKEEVDANFKRMLRAACEPSNLEAARVGVGSHNLFDISYALLLREDNPLSHRIEFEMLEGMANAQAEIVQERAGGLLVYAPVVQSAQFPCAIAYLVRRLKENTGEHNFLRDLFGLQVDSPAWCRQREAFLNACALSHSNDLRATPHRIQNRATENTSADPPEAPFANASDTDFSLPQNREWIRELITRCAGSDPSPVDTGIAGQSASVQFPGEGHDPSRPGTIAYRHALADRAGIECALHKATSAQADWEQRGVHGRAAILKEVAAVFARHRGETIDCMARDAGKAVLEADTEISEAVDFANYYARSLDQSSWHDGTTSHALGVVLVTPPWNFPYAIPAGGCLAALMAGNAVILKPAPEAVLTARRLAEHLWEAGVPRDVLQFVPVSDNEDGQALVTDDRIAAVILTGAYQTASRFRLWKPSLRLFAETSGKNSLIITQGADLDLAIRDLVKGAFGHAGQKCSATSLALVERAVYEDPLFRSQLKDAAESLPVGSAWDRARVITPLIRKPDADLHRALTELDPGESWLLKPRMIDDNPCLWSPGIKLGVKRGSWFHRTECFGPVLGIICAHDFEEAREIQNDNQFGLTAGLHSLDETEIATWRNEVEAGNAYINRSTTGAIVQRQPFGGWKKSSVGPGRKAGGPNYVSMFAHWKENGLPTLRATPEEHHQQWVDQRGAALTDPGQRDRLQASLESYSYWWAEEFSKEHDPSQLRGETNTFRYVAHRRIILRISNSGGPTASDLNLAVSQLALACRVCGSELEVSCDSTPAPNLGSIAMTIESESHLISRLPEDDYDGLRILGTVSDELRVAANDLNLTLSSAPVLSNGRLELLHFLREQSISETTHRYGNVTK